ncbi:uncharacterized protein LOC120129780 [Hibiscus syriacus]|uniref:uncharacterized protein LOC120129780 n=1 Tax=Hibiscus syriacus TaxID=106335 RepID=UPI0019232D63|nr:uncharacterized protein LOC120129780 [Hibiscus syriacus]
MSSDLLLFARVSSESPGSVNGFLQEVIRVEEFLKDPWGVRVSREGTVQVPVPKLAPVAAGDREGAAAVEKSASVLAQTRWLALQRKAAATMAAAAEDYSGKVESGYVAVIFLRLALCNVFLLVCLYAYARCR